jgi:hypothetical protein
MTFLVTAFRSPQVPSRSLPFPLDKVTPERSRRVATDRYSRPIGRRSQCAANGARSTSATITFLGEQQDIFNPDAAVTAARQTTEPVNSNRRNHPQPAPLL